MLSLCEACVDSLHSLDVFGGDAEIVEVDLKASVGLVFVVVAVCRDNDGVVRGQGFALASEATGFVFFFAAKWSCQGRTWVGAKTAGVRHSSGMVKDEIKARKSKLQALLCIS